MLRYLLCVLMSMLFAGAVQATSFNGGSVANCKLAAKTYTCSTIFANDNDTADIASGYTVLVSADLTFGYFQDLRMTGSARLETTGSYNISITNTQQNTFSTGGATIKAGGNFSLGNGKTMAANIIATTVDLVGSPSKITGTITATGTVNLVSGTQVTGAVSSGDITIGADAKLGSSLTATGAIKLESRVTVASGVSGGSIKTDSDVKITGAVDIAGLADFASGSTVTGNVDAGSLTLRSANATINGNVTVTGDTLLENSTVINGDLDANNVRTGDSNASINGNASVNSIYFGYGGTVSKVITCKNPPTPQKCSCVSYASTYSYSPSCATAPPAGAHHFQITHGGSALTCQPQTVKVTACANAACTAPNYTGSSTVTLQPGGKSFSFTGQTSSATVAQTSVGTATLAIAGSTATTCINTANSSAANQCAMAFDDTGLLVSVDDHIAMKLANVRIQALAASGNKQSCVPLVAGKKENIDTSCAFVNPVPAKANAAAKVTINGAGLSCGGGTARVLLDFDKDGIATTTLTYPEVGQVALTAAYAGSAGAGYAAKGTGNFIAAPARFTIAATSASGKSVAYPTVVSVTSAVFAKADEGFTVKISAVNDQGAVTTNFGKEKTPENMALAIPVVDNPADAGNAGAITVGAWNPITDGVSGSATGAKGLWRFSDVGIIRVDVGLTSGAGYLGFNRADFKTAGTQNIGRFIPDHFDTSLPIAAALNVAPLREEVPYGQTAGMTMPCKATATSTALLAPCDAVFVYAYQPFYVLVKAYGATTMAKNYQGSLAKAITLSAATSQDGATLVASTVGAMAGSVAGAAPGFTFVNGVGRVEDAKFNLPTGLSVPVFGFKALPSATTGSNPVQFFVRAVDTDGATSQGADTSIGEQAVTAVSGRLLVPNVDGSPSSSMPVTVQAQFYDASRGFIFNPRYAAPAKSVAGYLSFDHCQQGLASNQATFACTPGAQLQPVAPATASFGAGKAGFRLQAPAGLTGRGAVNLTLLQPCTTAPGCAAVQWISYLPSTTGKLTFGTYRSGPVIYTREVY